LVEDKELLLSEYGKHVQHAKEQKDHYRTQVKSGKQNLMGLPDDLKNSGNLFCGSSLHDINNNEKWITTLSNRHALKSID